MLDFDDIPANYSKSARNGYKTNVQITQIWAHLLGAPFVTTAFRTAVAEYSRFLLKVTWLSARSLDRDHCGRRSCRARACGCCSLFNDRHGLGVNCTSTPWHGPASTIVLDGAAS
jgi:hypothetical protein